MKRILIILLVSLSTQTFAQDTLSVMYYNLLRFPSAQANREDTLRKILQYAKPDILLVCELETNAAANSILNNSLNVGGISYYQKANFIDGFDMDNMMYYNSNKVALVSQQNIPTVVRDISEYLVYSKQSLGTTNDTVFIHLYCMHLKAGSDFSDEQDRKNMVNSLKNRIDNLPWHENIIAGGDMNFYYNTEPAYPVMTSVGTVSLFDPINAVGSWNNNASFSNVHTQSTRSVQLYGGASGGMDDRFDQIFVNNELLNGAKNCKYITGSYTTLGQDGQHFNKAINASPNNTSAPDSIINALYYMSDHLPISIDLLIDYTLGGDEYDTQWNAFYYHGSLMLNSEHLEHQMQVEIWDEVGRRVSMVEAGSGTRFTVNLELSPGFYIAKFKGEHREETIKFFHH